MARFGLNLRPIYDEDELTGGERLAQGVAGGIDELLRRRREREAQAEAERQETNEFAMEGFEAVPRGREALAPPPRMRRTPDFNPNAGQPSPVPRGVTPTFPQVGVTPSGIGSAIGFELEQQQPGAGYETVRSRSGQQFRRPGVQMREQAASDRRVREERAGATARAQAASQFPKPTTGMTQDQRLAVERARTERAERVARINAAARSTAAAISSGRGNTTTQLNALRELQQSYDSEVRTMRAAAADAARRYDYEEADALNAQLEELVTAADENRALLAKLTGQSPRGRTTRPPPPTPAPSPIRIPQPTNPFNRP